MKKIPAKQLTNDIRDWLKNRLEESGTKGFVVGISGGIDSAVTAVLCQKVADTFGLILPIETPATALNDARFLVTYFDIPYREIDLNVVYQTTVRVLKAHRKTAEIARSNLKPRLRMTTLYYYANQRNAIVVGTSNKTEISLGYFTKFGDGGADLFPLAGLLKRDVRRIGEYLGIPRAILDKPPSADLMPNQTDEKDLGAPYEILDKIVIGETRGIDQKIVKKIQKRIKKNLHKDPEFLLKGLPNNVYHHPDYEKEIEKKK
ncbi:MAG: NAD(+) synthase [Candidatus Ranarchaeia archaeon]